MPNATFSLLLSVLSQSRPASYLEEHLNSFLFSTVTYYLQKSLYLCSQLEIKYFHLVYFFITYLKYLNFFWCFYLLFTFCEWNTNYSPCSPVFQLLSCMFLLPIIGKFNNISISNPRNQIDLLLVMLLFHWLEYGLIKDTILWYYSVHFGISFIMLAFLRCFI